MTVNTEARCFSELAKACAARGEAVYRLDTRTDTLEWIVAPQDDELSSALNSLKSGQCFERRMAPESMAQRRAWLSTELRFHTPFSTVHEIALHSRIAFLKERLVCVDGEEAGTIFGFLSDAAMPESQNYASAAEACIDPLTGALNRTNFGDALACAIEEADGRGKTLSLAFIGLDNMAGINQTFGHEITDDVLRAVGARIREALSPDEPMGRVASSKFGVMLMSDPAQAETRLRALQDSVGAALLTTRSGAVSVTVSVGIVVAPEEAKTADSAMSAAEEALISAKTQGHVGLSRFQPNAGEVSRRRENLAIAEEFCNALRSERLHVAAQPIVVAGAETDVAFYECLARIVDHSGAVVPAGRFMPVAEKLGFVRALDQRILARAFAMLDENENIRLSVNVSPQSLFDPGWQRIFDRLTERSPHLTSRLIVEITEAAAIHDADIAADRIRAIAAKGCKLALDDFGAGYTSFRHFQTMQFDMVKIDGAFVRGILESPDNRMFVATLSGLAHHFEMDVVAEMVDNDEAGACLRELGVGLFQGFHYGRPEIVTPLSLPTLECHAPREGSKISAVA